MKRLFPIVSILFSVFLGLLVAACGNKNSTSTTAAVSGGEQEYMKIITITTNEPVVLDSPEKFIQVYVLFHHYNSIWLAQTATNTNLMEVESYLSNKRVLFYKSLGLTENDLANYTQHNYKLVNDLLDQNEAYKKAYESVQY